MLAQVRPPDELLILDQGGTDESVRRIRALFPPDAPTRLRHIHDTSITGLVDAKRVGSGLATGDIVCFLEDDVVLEAEYFAAIVEGFVCVPDMIGCSGIMTNPPKSSPLYVRAHRLFFRGIFDDPRVSITAAALERAHGLVRCDILSGGLSCWRREVFTHVKFDAANGFFMLEDMEFATRVVRRLGSHLYINPHARLAHYGSPVNRDVHGVRQQRKTTEALVFYRKRRDWPGAVSGLGLALLWWLGEALLQTVRLRSSGPLLGYVRGVARGATQPIHTGPPSTA